MHPTRFRHGAYPTLEQIHAARKPRSDTVAVGTAYEQLCLRFLSAHLPTTVTDLRGRGGAGDQGIDIAGRLQGDGGQRQVLVQCKALTAKVVPDDIRAFEGVLHHSSAAASSSTARPLGVFFAAGGYGPGCFDRCKVSQLPMLLLHLPRTDKDLHGRLRGLVANRAAEEALAGRVRWQFVMAAAGDDFVQLSEQAEVSARP
jgi:hypothetical protein